MNGHRYEHTETGQTFLVLNTKGATQQNEKPAGNQQQPTYDQATLQDPIGLLALREIKLLGVKGE